MRGQMDALVLPVWRGHVPTDAEGALALIAAERFEAAQAYEVFLGLLPGGQPVFARDVSVFAPLVADEEAAPPSPWSTAGVAFQEFEGLIFRDLRAVMTTLTPLEAEMAGTARGLFEWHRSHGFCAACGVKTEMSQAGWQRECPACSASHFPRTDPVVIMLVTHGNSVLLGRNENWPERMYSLLAGFVEPGEPIEAAVRREVYEEAGVRVGKVSYVTSQPWPFPASLMLGCRAEALSTEIIIDPVEIEDARWVRREELARAMVGLHEDIAPARKGAIAQVLMAKWLADDWE